MTTLRTAAQQALEALESADWYINQLEQIVYSDDDTDTHEERAKVQAAVTALRAALAEPDGGTICPRCGKRANGIHTCTAPPQRKPLTDDEIADAANSVKWSKQYHVDFARAIEQAHGIKERA